MRDLSNNKLESILPDFLKTDTKETNKKVVKQYYNKYSVSDKYIYKEPKITTNDYVQTLKNFRLFRDLYNTYSKDQNQQIKQYNNQTLIYNKQTTITLGNLKYIESFQKQYSKLSINNYNRKVEEQNKINKKLLLLKKTHKPLKKHHENSFKTLIGFYTSQIDSKNLFLKNSNKNTTRVLEKLRINYCHWANHKVNGVKVETSTKRTLQNHVYRLRDAGIILNYEFINSKSAVYCEINHQILTISDQINPKTQNTENHFFKYDTRQNLHNNNISNINKIKKTIKKNSKENLIISFEKERKLQEHDSLNTKFEREKKCKKPILLKKEKSCAKKEKKQNINDIIIKETIPNSQLANKLESKEIDTHLINKEILKYEKDFGFLTKKEYTAIMVKQIIIILFSKLYKTHKISFYSGVWYKAIKRLEDRFLTNRYSFSKEVMYKTYLNYENAIEFASNWFKDNNWQPINPYDYLDPSRTHSFEMGFQFVLNKTLKYQRNLEKQKENYHSKRKVLSTTAKHRQNLYKQIMRYRNGKITLEELYLYSQKLPKQFRQNLSKYIKTM